MLLEKDGSKLAKHLDVIKKYCKLTVNVVKKKYVLKLNEGFEAMHLRTNKS